MPTYVGCEAQTSPTRRIHKNICKTAPFAFACRPESPCWDAKFHLASCPLRDVRQETPNFSPKNTHRVCIRCVCANVCVLRETRHKDTEVYGTVGIGRDATKRAIYMQITRQAVLRPARVSWHVVIRPVCLLFRFSQGGQTWIVLGKQHVHRLV